MAKVRVRMRSLRLRSLRMFRGLWARLKEAVLECELTLLGFERSPPARVLASSGWDPDFPGTYCGRCGATLLLVGEECRECLCRHLPYARVVRLGAYEEPLSSWIRAIKFAGWEAMGRQLGMELARSFETTSSRGRDMRILIAPVPMPRLRRLVRGIDHAQVLARAFANHMHAPLREPLRQGSGVTQVTRTAAQRERRRNPFFPQRFTRSLDGATVILVDDVLTSGKTARAAARAIRRLGAAKVVLAVVAVADTRPFHDHSVPGIE